MTGSRERCGVSSWHVMRVLLKDRRALLTLLKGPRERISQITFSE
jgi:hypothetical protein